MIIRLLKLVPNDPNVNFFGHRLYAYIFSAIVIIGSLYFVATKGLNLGIDFTGGTVIEIRVNETPDLPELRGALNELDLGAISIQEFGAPQDLMIRLQQQEGGPEAQQAAIESVRTTLNARFGEDGVEYRRTEFVGPQVGDELRRAGIMAVIFAIIGILGYISVRFEWQYGVAAVAALMHDVIAVLGLFALTQMQFDLSTVAAILLVAGYSINDTVVVFDRVRENLRKYKKMPMPELINQSLNQMLARTIMTSVTTLLALFALWLFGGEVIRGFVDALFFGIAIGTHSSIFVAAPLLVYLNVRRTAEKKEEAEIVDNPA